ncbi:MAG: TIGR03663 family protein [Prosthecobacter sp.]
MPAAAKSLSLFALVVFTVVSLALAAYYRFPSLGERPMHTDEAILAMKSAEFQETGHFAYDPKDFHGPGLHYITRVWAKLAGWGDVTTWSEASLRKVTVMCSLLLLLCTLLLRDGLGRLATGYAMLFMAVAPMEVFYARYFIMEVPLVLFVTLSIAALWRWSQGGSTVWLVVAGAALGFQHATKETFILNIAAAAVGMAAAKLIVGDFAPRQTGFSMGTRKKRAAKPWLWVLVAAVLTSVTLYSGFFHDWQAVKDSALTYLNYLQRSEGSGHEKPWHYYITLIFYRKDTIVWSEAMIGTLALVGIVHAFIGNHMRNPARQAFLVFLSVYALALFGIYSFLAYKTPWSILSGEHALILLAGVGAAAISQAIKGGVLRLVFRIAIAVGLYHLVFQTSFAIHRYAADPRNPYVYSHTSSSLMRLRPKVRELQKIAPDDAFNILVVNRDAGWPLPWYWRDIKSVTYTSDLPEVLDARIIVAEPGMEAAIKAKLGDKPYVKEGGPYGLRPGVLLDMWVEKSLWERSELNKQQEATSR